MTAEEVEQLVRSQGADHLSESKHGIKLGQALVPPQKIPLIVRTVRDGRVRDNKQSVWLVGRESAEGYLIVMREDGVQFGLASAGFPTDEHPILVGWYGGLVSAFLSM